MTDVWIEVDRMMLFRLFRPDRSKGESKVSLAGTEAMKMKKLVGGLRALWRSAQENGFDTRVTELKSYLRSPSRQTIGEHVAESQDQDGEGPADFVIPEDPGDGHSADDGDNDGGSDDDEGFAAEALGSPSSPVEEPQGDADGPSQSDSLNASTLRLGGEAGDETEDEIEGEGEEEEDMDDDETEKKTDEKTEEKTEEDYKQEVMDAVLNDIRMELERQLETEIAETDGWKEYKGYCQHALVQYGTPAFGTLSSQNHFHQWLQSDVEA